MRSWVAWANRSSECVPRPIDAPQAHAQGHDSDRVLIFGAGLAVGWGVTTHALALPGSVARALSAHTGRGTDVDLVADDGMNAEQSVSALDHVNLWRYDAIVVVLGVNDALRLTSLSVWRREMSKLLWAMADSMPAETKIIITGIQPIRSIPIFDTFLGSIAERHASALNRETAKLCARSARATFVPLAALQKSASPDGRHRSPDKYAGWGKVIAESLAPLLAAQYHVDGDRRQHGAPRPSITEKTRQKAVDELALADSGSHARLQRILSLAQRAFHAEAALITVLDRDRQWHLARVGTELEEVPRSSSFCDFAIHGRDAMIVRDARKDDRFKNNLLVVGGPQIRFYAGFPIELPSGERIGALCVFDSQPRRRAADFDDILLRELSLMAQQELWRYIPGSAVRRGKPVTVLQ